MLLLSFCPAHRRSSVDRDGQLALAPFADEEFRATKTVETRIS
jgi:hypothetical protein